MREESDCRTGRRNSQTLQAGGKITKKTTYKNLKQLRKRQ